MQKHFAFYSLNRTFAALFWNHKKHIMNKIVRKEQFSEKVFLLEVEAPLIAKSRKAGNFVIVRVDKLGERMPLTIAEADTSKGTITLVVQKVGLSSTKLCNLNEGDYVADVVGPLGNPTHIEKFGTVICAGGGVGVAPMLPIIQALKAAGNRVLSVLAGRSKDLIIMEDKVRESSDEVIIMTDDGSYGEKGVVTVGIEKFIKQEGHIDRAFAIGPPIMMKFSCLLTQKYNIPTDVSLNTIMVDGTCASTVPSSTEHSSTGTKCSSAWAHSSVPSRKRWSISKSTYAPRATRRPLRARKAMLPEPARRPKHRSRN